jgi:hypothetical protein
MDSIAANINKLVSLTFDENPAVRRQAAKSLSEINDPGAVFALVELSFDKDSSVREVAQKYLDKKKQTEPELMSFAGIFSKHGEEDKEGETQAAEAKERMLRPITQIFEKRLGKEKAEMARSKLMPSIEKVYLKAHQPKRKNDDNGRKVMQEFLTNYLEVMSDLDRIGSGTLPITEQLVEHVSPEGPSSEQAQERAHEDGHPRDAEGLATVLEEVGKSTGGEMDKLSMDASSLELAEIEEIKERAEIEKLPDTFFKKAYETMMLSGGDEDVLKQEMNRMIEDARREIGLAFRLAKKRFKELKITNITKIKDGMKNIDTDVLIVRAVETIEYQKTKKVKATANRVTVNDETGNEGIVYVFEGRGAGIQPGMRIKVKKAVVMVVRGETALTIAKKGNVYIVL